METKDLIYEIAQELDCGNRVFIHKTTRERISVPDTDNFIGMDDELEPWSKELELLENNFSDYYEVEKWTSNEAYDIMMGFTENLTDNPKLHTQLARALSSKKPFREFKHVIDQSGDYRQQWFDFKNQRQEEYVARELKGLEL